MQEMSFQDNDNPKGSNSYWYAVYKGHESGVYNDWNKVLTQIKGFSKPVFKKFHTLQEAQQFVKYGPINREQIIQVREIGQDKSLFVPDLYVRYYIEVVEDLSTTRNQDGDAFVLHITGSGYSKQVIAIPPVIANQGKSMITLYGMIRIIETFQSRISHGALNQMLGNERLDIVIVGDVHAWNIVNKYMLLWKQKDWTDSKGKTIVGVNIVQALYDLLEPLQQSQVVKVSYQKQF